MNGFLDIHTHILPGIDDGSKDMQMTLEMLKMAYDEGVRCIAATPHYYPGYRNASMELIRERFEQVKEEAAEPFPDMTLILGNEIFYKDGVVDLLKENQIFTMADTRYALVEFNVSLEYAAINRAIKQFVFNGFYPIIAHVERYKSLHRQPGLVEELIEAGAYIQVNAETFLGGFFDPMKKYCMQLLAGGMVHFLGSDAHRTDRRVPIMQRAVNELGKKIDTEILERVLYRNPKCFLNNEFI